MFGFTNLIINRINTDIYRNDLLSCLKNISGKIILVASETGLGIVPDNKLSRQFRDSNGLTNQAIAGHGTKRVFSYCWDCSKD